MSGRRTVVVGAGVVGLTVAYELASRGHLVTVIGAEPAQDTVSSAAGAIWFPYATESSAAAGRRLLRSRLRFEELALDPSTGVDLRSGLLVEREKPPVRTWTEAAGDWCEARPEELPAGALGGVRAVLPVISVPEYLTWLQLGCAEAGVRFEQRRLERVDDLAGVADLAVVAGLESGRLLGDDEELYPIRGQIVRLENPGLREWLLDENHPDGLTYVIPRRADIVCGGTSEPGVHSREWDADTERAILTRAVSAVPELAGLRVLSRAVGLRPARPVLRLGPVPDHALPVLACYGHGGAGVTLSWGCAEEIAGLVEAAGRT